MEPTLTYSLSSSIVLLHARTHCYSPLQSCCINMTEKGSRDRGYRENGKGEVEQQQKSKKTEDGKEWEAGEKKDEKEERKGTKGLCE